MTAGSSSHPTASADFKGWDWNGIIGTGQSLSVGAMGMPIKSTTPKFGNLKVDSGDMTWPATADDSRFSVVPLVEPVGRSSRGYPSSWPQNIDGEGPHMAAANEISTLALDKLKHDHTTLHFSIGESGQGMIRIKKNAPVEGVNGRSYAAAMINTQAVVRLAKAAGKSFGVSAIFLTHGETDTGNPKYETEVYQLWTDYNTDVKTLTGQKQDVLMITSQHNRLGDYSPSTNAQWKVGVDYPTAVVCSGPKYQYPYASDALHLSVDGYQQLGEKYGEVYFERVLMGRNWMPLQPESTTLKGTVLRIKFHVPNKPLQWDTTLGEPHPSTPEWARGKGFEVVAASGSKVAIESVKLVGADSVEIQLASDPGAGARVSYAMLGEQTMRNPRFGATPHWGLLRDSDPFVGATTKVAQPNFCVAFDVKLP